MWPDRFAIESARFVGAIEYIKALPGLVGLNTPPPARVEDAELAVGSSDFRVPIAVLDPNDATR